MGVIFTLSHQPGSGKDWEPPLWYVIERKSAHVFEYAVLALLTIFFLRAWYPMGRLAHVLLFSLLFATTFGLLDEVHQFFIFGRSARFTDVAFDVLGALIAVGAYWFWIKKRVSTGHS